MKRSSLDSVITQVAHEQRTKVEWDQFKKNKGFVNLNINVADELSIGLFLLNRVMVYLLSTMTIKGRLSDSFPVIGQV